MLEGPSLSFSFPVKKSQLLSHFSHVRLCATPSLGFSRQEHWSGLPFPSPMHNSEKWKWSRSAMSDSWRPHELQPMGTLRPWDFPGKSIGVGCHCLLRRSLKGLSWSSFNHLYYTANASPHTLLAAFQCLPHLFTWVFPGLTKPQLNSSWKGREQSLGKCRSARSFILLGAEYIPYFSKHYYPLCLSSQRGGSDSSDS